MRSLLRLCHIMGAVALSLCAVTASADEGDGVLGAPYFEELRARAQSAFDELDERIDEDFDGGARRQAQERSAAKERAREARKVARQTRQARKARELREAERARELREAERARETERSLEAERARARAAKVKAAQARRARERAERAGLSPAPVQRRQRVQEPTGGSSFEAQLLALVNQERARGGDCGGRVFEPSGPLKARAELARAAQLHAEAMERERFFDHRDPRGEGPKERIDAQGYQGRAWGENIAAGQRSPESVMRAWMRSPGHCKNILNPLFNELGVGLVLNAEGPYRTYWVQNFGRSR